ncbi:MAG: Gfo/Idh/MocA family oxidoreductase [Myxococcaceae bacterium]|nr:Gfo/Idh/MocA family oxidoreductase [Myxococcaceae bacterium]
MRVGIVGTSWGRMHIGAFRAAGAEVVALCGGNLEKTRGIAQREGIALATNDVAALCRDVELVVVASPDAMHRDHVKSALALGKHVLCEKPLAMTLDEANDLATTAEASGRRCAVSFPYRQLPPLTALRKWLPRVREIDVTLRSSFVTTLEGSGDFGGMSHVIDAALWLAGGDAESVAAAISGQSVSINVALRGGGVLNLVHRPTVEPGIHGTWSIAGDGFEAGFFAGYQPSLSGWRVSAPRACVEGTWRDIAPGVDPRAHQREPWAEAHVAAARAFLAGDMSRLASFREGAKVQAVIDAASRSHASGRRERTRA